MQNRTTQRRITRWAQFLSSRAGYQRRQTRCAKRSVCNPILPVRTLPSLPCCASKETRPGPRQRDRKSTRLNSSHGYISYAVFCLKKKKKKKRIQYYTAQEKIGERTMYAKHSIYTQY